MEKVEFTEEEIRSLCTPEVQTVVRKALGIERTLEAGKDPHTRLVDMDEWFEVGWKARAAVSAIGTDLASKASQDARWLYFVAKKAAQVLYENAERLKQEDQAKFDAFDENMEIEKNNFQGWRKKRPPLIGKWEYEERGLSQNAFYGQFVTQDIVRKVKEYFGHDYILENQIITIQQMEPLLEILKNNLRRGRLWKACSYNPNLPYDYYAIIMEAIRQIRRMQKKGHYRGASWAATLEYED